MANRSTEFPHIAITDRGYILGMGLGEIYVTPDVGLAMRLSGQGFSSMEKQVPCWKMSSSTIQFNPGDFVRIPIP